MITKGARVMLLSGDREISEAIAHGMERGQALTPTAEMAMEEARYGVLRARDAKQQQARLMLMRLYYNEICRPEPRWKRTLETAWCSLYLLARQFVDDMRRWWADE